jgi:predicted DNA binding protein
MREFVFDISYPDGGDPLMDVFGAYPELSSVGIHGVVDDGAWLIERFTGCEEGLAAAERRLREELGRIEALTRTPCATAGGVNVVRRSETERDLYVRLDAIDDCRSVHTLAAEYLGPDTVFKTERHGDSEEWQVIHRSEERVGLFYDALQAALRPELSFRFDHVGEASGWRAHLLSGVELPAEQRTALVAAVEHGYYESPREISLEKLSEILGWPRSTLSYRLRRAESELAEAGADVPSRQQTDPPIHPEPTDTDL